MSEYNIKRLKKQIIYRCLYTGTKETDLLYQKLIVNKIDTLTPIELYQLSNLFNEVSDADIFLILTNISIRILTIPGNPLPRRASSSLCWGMFYMF